MSVRHFVVEWRNGTFSDKRARLPPSGNVYEHFIKLLQTDIISIDFKWDYGICWYLLHSRSINKLFLKKVNLVITHSESFRWATKRTWSITQIIWITKYNKTTNKTDALARPNDASLGRNRGAKCERGTDGDETHNRITYLQHHLVGRDDDVCTYVMLPATGEQKAGRRRRRRCGAGGHAYWSCHIIRDHVIDSLHVNIYSPADWCRTDINIYVWLYITDDITLRSSPSLTSKWGALSNVRFIT